ncbi:PIN domain-containing protein [Paraburkholderia tropica]|uniref:PIN domain-containing protein n=1 Tax=Paraburkholderia tropica TaxID=92647 RepID=UPI002AB77AA8|nr:PIN domain-containing protein [Paraburkholderia tropica]
MRNEFPGYFKPSDKEVEDIWKAGLIVFDTNALLNLYRYTEATRIELLSAIRRLKDRVRLPYQVAGEFFRNRTAVISEQRRAYSEVLKAIGEAKQKAGQAIGKHERQNGLFDAKHLKKRLEECLQPLLEEVVKLQEAQPDLLGAEDPILNELCQLVEGRVLSRSIVDDDELRTWALERIEAGIPPGPKDSEKDDGGIGDAIIWHEILGLATAEKRPIIFVSDDTKADWVQEVEGKKIGALPALRQELLTSTGQDFQHYTVQRFLQWYKKNEKQQVSEASIEEAATVRNEVKRAEELSRPRAQVMTAAELLSMDDSVSEATRARNWAEYEALMRDAQYKSNEIVMLEHKIRGYERALGQTSDTSEIRKLEAGIEWAVARKEELERHRKLFYRLMGSGPDHLQK